MYNYADYRIHIDNAISNDDISALMYKSMICDLRPIFSLRIKKLKNKLKNIFDDQRVQKLIENNLII